MATRHRAGRPTGPPSSGDRPAVKQASTFYTAPRVAAARRNIERFGWASAIRDDAVSRADRFLGLSDTALWSLVTPQTLPRSYAVNQELGSPITGQKLFAFGRFPWRADPLARPWKLVDPSSGYVFPTNDFAAFYASGLDDHGIFDRERADDRLLVNELYPERGPGWGVDDGLGWIDDDGNTWTFIAYYIHWWLWYRASDTTISEPVIWDALDAFRDAWLYTGDPAYARAGLILLDRIADVYPAMDTSRYARSDGFLASDGLRDRGKIVGSIWETAVARHLAAAYDAFFPAIATHDDANLVPFLHAQATRYALDNPKASTADIRSNIEHGILRQIYPAVRETHIYGNFGMHQSALAMAAVVLDDPVASKEWIDFIYRSNGSGRRPHRMLQGGHLLATLIDDVDRDGFGDEAAPHYNSLWLDHMLDLAGILRGYDRYPSADLFLNARFRQMFDAWPHLVMAGAYTPTIGDTPKIGNPHIVGTARHYVTAFEQWGDPLYARFAFLLNGNSLDGLHPGIFSDDPAATMARIGAVVHEHGPLRPRSENLSGYGLAVLRDGEPGNERDAWVYYGRNDGHGHADALNLGLHAFGVDLSPDLGYPEFADHNPKRLEWTRNTISHNTVTVDATTQGRHWAGIPRQFVDTGRVRLVDVEAPSVYAATSLYRRVTALVRFDAERSYVVDLFRLHGGNDHHFSFHGAEGEVTTEGLDLRPQGGGTYAGDDVPFATSPSSSFPGSGFTWLDNVTRDTHPPEHFSLDWKVVDTWGVLPEGADVHLRLTMLGAVDDVALADGYPAANQPGNPERLRYLIAHRQGHDLASQFVSVIEPYVGNRAILSISRPDVVRAGGRVDADVAAVRIELPNGRTDYVVSALDPDIEVVVDNALLFRGSLGVCSLVDGAPEYGFLAQGSLLGTVERPLLQGVRPALAGTLVAFTRELSRENRLDVRFHEDVSGVSLIDHFIHIDNDNERNAVYRILDARRQESGTYVLEIGAATLIRRLADRTDIARGYVYDVTPGAPFTIPLYHEWTA